MVDFIVEFNPERKEDVEEELERNAQKSEELSEKGLANSNIITKKFPDGVKDTVNAIGDQKLDYKFLEDGKVLVTFASLVDPVKDADTSELGLMKTVKAKTGKKWASHKAKKFKKKIKKEFISHIGKEDFYSISIKEDEGGEKK